MRTFLLIALGGVLMFIILKYMSSKTATSSGTVLAFKSLAKTQEVGNLIRTNEFRELIKTSEFKTLMKTLGEDYLVEMAKTMTGTYPLK